MMKFLSETVRTDNFDNLQPWRVYELRESATTLAGRSYPAGTEFWFEYAIVTRKTRDALVHGTTPEGEHLVFPVHDYAHRHLFIDTGREWRPRKAAAAAVAVAPPLPAAQDTQVRENPANIRWLAAQPQFAQASRILAGQFTDSYGYGDADVLRRAALALEHTQPQIAAWLADRSLDLYHAWMSQATSGGEGTAMQNQIRNELADMRRLIERGASK